MRRTTRRTALALALGLAALLVTPLALHAGGPPGGPGGGGGQKGTIVGEVVGASGPIAGATVMLFDGASIDQVAETHSNADGSFSFGKLAAGDYTVTAISWNPPCSGSTSVTVAPKKIVVVVVACQ
jgi:hypothetical protein